MKFKKFVIAFDLFNFISIEDIRKIDNVEEKKLNFMYSENLKGNSFYGFESLYEINKRVGVLWIFLPLMYLLKISGAGNYLYNELSVKRKIFPLTCSDNCNLNFKL